MSVSPELRMEAGRGFGWPQVARIDLSKLDYEFEIGEGLEND